MSMRGPWSGDVTQSILPWNFFNRYFAQVGFININNAKTPAPELETTIIEEVGSYGRQIGRIADALDVLIGTLDRTSLNEKQFTAIIAFREQLGEVRAIKAKDRHDPERDDLSKPTARLAADALARSGGSRRGAPTSS